MSAWGRIFAAGYDHIMSGPEKATLRTHREALIPQANGQVLEIGGGTGANLPFYKSTATITLTEPDKPMMRRLERRLRERCSGIAAPTRSGRGSAVRRRQLRCGHLHPRALHGRRPTASATRTPASAQARRPPTLHRARTLR